MHEKFSSAKISTFTVLKRVHGCVGAGRGWGGGGVEATTCSLHGSCSGGYSFEKGGGALTQNFQINGFWPEFNIKKSKICGKKGGARPPPPLNPRRPMVQHT